MRILTFVGLLLLTGTVNTQAQEKILFRYNPPVGDTSKYNIDMNMDIAGEAAVVMDMRLMMAQTAQAKSEKNTFILNSKIESIKVDMNAGMMMISYDSEKPDESDPMAQEIAKQFKPLLDANIAVETSEKAEVVEISGTEAAQSMIDIKQLFNSVQFPEQAVQAGDSWKMDVEHEQLGVTLKYVLTYTGLQDGLHRVDLVTDPDAPAIPGMTISASGFNLYAPQTFALEKSEITSKIDASNTNITSQAVLQRL